jgi:hypothetical protein
MQESMKTSGWSSFRSFGLVVRRTPAGSAFEGAKVRDFPLPGSNGFRVGFMTEVYDKRRAGIKFRWTGIMNIAGILTGNN